MPKIYLFGALIALFFAQCTPQKPKFDKDDERLEIAAAFEFWNQSRMYPDGKLHTEKLMAALQEWRSKAVDRGGPFAEWEAIGPKNIGGRTISFAIHPQNPDILFMGAASGGLWKSTTQGKGALAWERIETGFPVIGVGAIAIDPVNPNNLYIGTGEVYNFENSAPNNVIRTTRGTYGIGILKSTDGGATWQKSWDANYNDLTGVQEIKINPLRPQTVYATTTEGLLRSYNGGASWTKILDRKMAVDLDLSLADTSVIFVTFGSLDDQPVSGVFRSLDGGNNFAQLTNGLPASYSGKTMLDISKSNPQILYASVADAFVQKGLYKSENGGNTWQVVNTTDVCTYQGWYSHDVAISPTDPNRFLWCGIDMFLSTNGGATAQRVTYWYNWDFGIVPVGGPEGPPDYVHADIHHIYYHDDNLVYCVTDGGLFASLNGGGAWEGRNGSYQTQQFYANFSNSATDPNKGVGGMQDNATAVYLGDGAWKRVIGGDGGSTAINPFDDNIMYGSSQNGNFYLSNDAFDGFSNFPAPLPGTNSAFIAPFELAPSNAEVVYSGKNILCKFDFTQGGEWQELSSAGGSIVTIAVNPNDENDVYFSRAPINNEQPKIFKINAITEEVVEMSGLPNRICMDIARHPTDANTVYAVMSGFGTEHLWRTTNGGTTWAAVPGIPDVPTNSVLVDPLIPQFIYVANDLGVWFSPDEGQTWEHLSADGPQAMLAMHLSITADRKLRVATHGLGVWQTAMKTSGTEQVVINKDDVQIWPNPAVDAVQVQWKGAAAFKGRYSLHTTTGAVAMSNTPLQLMPGESQQIAVGQLADGVYWLILEQKGQKQVKKVVIQR